MFENDPDYSFQFAASGPLVFTFVLSSTVSITTTVTGDSRQYATVAIVNGAVTLWSATTTQFANKVTIPFDLIAGPLTIKAGGGFVLQIPTAQQNGSVTAALTIATANNPDGTQFAAAIASWPLVS
jgi:hypothetical protein